MKSIKESMNQSISDFLGASHCFNESKFQNKMKGLDPKLFGSYAIINSGHLRSSFSEDESLIDYDDNSKEFELKEEKVTTQNDGALEQLFHAKSSAGTEPESQNNRKSNYIAQVPLTSLEPATSRSSKHVNLSHYKVNDDDSKRLERVSARFIDQETMNEPVREFSRKKSLDDMQARIRQRRKRDDRLATSEHVQRVDDLDRSDQSQKRRHNRQALYGHSRQSSRRNLTKTGSLRHVTTANENLGSSFRNTSSKEGRKKSGNVDRRRSRSHGGSEARCSHSHSHSRKSSKPVSSSGRSSRRERYRSKDSSKKRSTSLKRLTSKKSLSPVSARATGDATSKSSPKGERIQRKRPQGEESIPRESSPNRGRPHRRGRPQTLDSEATGKRGPRRHLLKSEKSKSSRERSKSPAFRSRSERSLMNKEIDRKSPACSRNRSPQPPKDKIQTKEMASLASIFFDTCSFSGSAIGESFRSGNGSFSDDDVWNIT